MSAGQALAVQNAFAYIAGQLMEGQTTLANQGVSANVNIDLALGTRFIIPITATSVVVTLNALQHNTANPSGLALHQRFSVTFQNKSGGAIGTPLSNASVFRTAGALPTPAAGKQQTVIFEYDAGIFLAYEVARTAADVTT